MVFRMRNVFVCTYRDSSIDGYYFIWNLMCSCTARIELTDLHEIFVRWDELGLDGVPQTILGYH